MRDETGTGCVGSGGTWNNLEIYAELGEQEALFDCLGTMVRGVMIEFLWTAPVFDPYRDDPRFEAALDRWNVVGYKTWPFDTGGDT